MKRFWDKVEKSDGCWIWMAAMSNRGYGKFHIVSRKWESAHRVAWKISNGKIPKGKCVCHKCDNPRCVRPTHLFIGTMRDNAIDMVKKGRNSRIRAIGSAHPRSIFTENDILEIRALKKDLWPCDAIASIFGCSHTTINHVTDRRTWNHI